MERWTTQVVRLGAELGPVPPDDLIPALAAFAAQVVVERADEPPDPGPEARAAVAALHRLLGRTPRPWCGSELDVALAGMDPTWAPVQAVRLAAAVAAGLLAGHLPAGAPWALHVDDPTGAAGPALGPVFDLVGGLLDGWDQTLAPPAVTTNVGSLCRAGAGYRPGGEPLSTVPDLWIDLDKSPQVGDGRDAADGDGPLRPPPWRDAPSVVVRPAPARAGDPGVPPPQGAPPNPGPALAVAARWCFPPALGRDEHGQHALLAALWEGSLPGAGGADDPVERWWRREAADLLLAARPDAPSTWCGRALVEAEHPAGSRLRHARLVEAAASTRVPAADLRRHAGDLRLTERPGWALDVWAVADAALQAELAADVVHASDGRHPGELALALAARVEAAASRFREVVAGQTAVDG